MPGQRLCEQRGGGHRPVELQEALATLEALQELSARVCKKLLMRRLTAKGRTALLEARGWPERGMKWAAGSKIRCSGRAGENEGMIMSDSTPASSAGKKQSEELWGHSQEAQ
ncbi:uncharacterized protein BDCG_04562 [Blastomyces dermatitidis ER-3]|uniref:Uncharacterized protein n=1 Tax=Ajellomyces dermatitidis (strain ER-3 / ATCC MYA-2586) TaxID=559297 RepID=A0ABP2EZK9_AJEDR|nr:uncharacterized protein BDCG_04562 [Blastomyces dermatitidis ER-3]EEQ89442.1 hypothetical protein BDCG_04562 [Blastomyces dermatitidis ER-3]